MLFGRTSRSGAAVFVTGIFATALLAPVLRSRQSGAASQEKTAEPWTNAQVLHAADVVRELEGTKDGSAPTIIYVGFRTLFEGGHIAGAGFHGTASKEDGLAELKKWLATLPKSTNLVVYCGCCPFDRCPNIRPAYTALHDMGFTRVRVLVLPTSFAADWVEKGYAMQKGLQRAQGASRIASDFAQNQAAGNHVVNRLLLFGEPRQNEADRQRN
jgi:thiosulfate/3-mercaptopyruvate sulfurtransferase